MDEEMILIPKAGDIKVDSNDLIQFIQCFEQYQYFILNNLDTLNEEERIDVQNCYDVYTRFLNKYIATSDLRRKEHLWFLLLKKIEKGEFRKFEKEEMKKYAVEDISLYISTFKSLFSKAQELPDTDFLLGLAIAMHTEEIVRREAWGVYLEIKAERESVVRKLNLD